MIHKQSKSASVSVVIVNHNAGPLLTRCVETALEQAHQIIVVDNASTDSSLAELETQFPTENLLKLTHTGTNLGFSAGYNIGLKVSITPYILFLTSGINGVKTLSRTVINDMVTSIWRQSRSCWIKTPLISANSPHEA